MRKLLRSNLVLAVGIGLLASYAVIGALAAPDVTPWPDPLVAGEEETETPEEEATETPEVEETELPEEVETPEPGDTPEIEGDVEIQQEGAGVPLDSPACTGTEEDPNPHDTDDPADFVGCREVDGKNLPDPAADAQEGNPGIIGHGDNSNGGGPPDGVPPGPPE